MNAIAELDKAESAFFSHQDPNMVEWFVKMVEERKTRHDSSKEKKNWEEMITVRGSIIHWRM